MDMKKTICLSMHGLENNSDLDSKPPLKIHRPVSSVERKAVGSLQYAGRSKSSQQPVPQLFGGL